MVFLPKQFRSFSKKGKELTVSDLEFSLGTYQIQVFDPKNDKAEWTFFQFDEENRLKDFFCSCLESEEMGGCPHLAASYFRIVDSKGELLHDRFRRSFWNKLFFLLAFKHGYHPDVLQSDKSGHFYCPDFFIEGKTPFAIQELQEILELRKQESEETSIKFSNLPKEEIDAWRSGKPTRRLRYELSFWNDLAKLFMKKQEEKKWLSFDFLEKEGIPSGFSIQFEGITLEVALDKKEFTELIPSFETVPTRFKLFFGKEGVLKEAYYDQDQKELHLEYEKDQIEHPLGEGIWFGEYEYFKGVGFYVRGVDAPVVEKIIRGEEIEKFLLSYPTLNFPIFREKKEIGYTLSFTEEADLTISSYLFSPGDLEKEKSADFGTFVFLEDMGFYRVEERLFPFVIKVLKKEIEPFIHHHRGWLNTKEGFHIQLTHLKSQIEYTLTKEGTLQFSRHLEISNVIHLEHFDFVPGKGFYPKIQEGSHFSFENKEISRLKIPHFIRNNRKELETISNFFLTETPFQKVGLHLEKIGSSLLLSPYYEPKTKWQEVPFQFFEEFVYFEGLGFYELIGSMRLPEGFREMKEIKERDLLSFFQSDFQKIEEWVSPLDLSLVEPLEFQFVGEELFKAPERGQNWYKIKLFLKTELGAVLVNDLKSKIDEKQGVCFSSAGRLMLFRSLFDSLRGFGKERFSDGFLFLTTLELIRLKVLEDLVVLNSESLMRELTDFSVPEDPVLEGFSSTLRPYQVIGVKWLWFLYHHKLSGLLCDDMGLGKTHQAMALIAAIRHQNKTLKTIIVCPTSVIYHWEEKLHQFFPELKVFKYYGGERSLKPFFKGFDVLLTSYGILRLDKEVLKPVSFDLAIFDEVQVAKNSGSGVHQAVKVLQADMRLGLTGTPIENELKELKALFDVVLPTYMPNHTDFRRLFVRPIEKQADRGRQALLKRFIKPFLLRRKKADVLFDLPPKTEEVSHCDLSTEQELLYNDVLFRSREGVIRDLKEGGAIPYIHIFAILSRLKEICNHPAVYLKEASQYKNYSSGKWDLFEELLDEALDSDQKVVVYSQFLTMLDIFEYYLEERGISFAEIRGATKDRGEQVKRFNQDPKCRVFLGSLGAAGLGIDLTAGSVVIHYDRWWNAAKENQATDRIHRIGQVRGVQVFKLVTKNTFEERIDEMIKRKGALMEEIIGRDDHTILKTFSREELIELLEEVKKPLL
jgi:SNF2 family DNA or RNA helicase